MENLERLGWVRLFSTAFAGAALPKPAQYLLFSTASAGAALTQLVPVYVVFGCDVLRTCFFFCGLDFVVFLIIFMEVIEAPTF